MSYPKLLKIILVTAVLSSAMLLGFYYIAINRVLVPARELARLQPKDDKIISDATPKNQEWLKDFLNEISTSSENVEAIHEDVEVSFNNKPLTTTEKIVKPDTKATTSLILHEVPFTSQAPFGEWDDPIQQDGCEEAASLMAVRWAWGEKLTLTAAKSEIIASSEYELRKYGEYRDTSASTTAERILGEYFNFENYEVKYDITVTDIISELQSGNILITPMNGQALGNPNYTAPGPDRHMLVVRGYDPVSREFITNDNGTRWGEEYRYNLDVFYNSIRDYPSGYKVPIKGTVKAMIVIKPEK